MKKYAVLYCSDPLGVSDNPRELVGESDNIHAQVLLKANMLGKIHMNINIAL